MTAGSAYCVKAGGGPCLLGDVFLSHSCTYTPSPSSHLSFRHKCHLGFLTPGISPVRPPPATGPDPQPCSKQELIMPTPPCPAFKSLYQAVNDWWLKEVLSNQSTNFPSSPSPNFSSKIQGAGTLSQIGEFTSATSSLQILPTFGILNSIF